MPTAQEILDDMRNARRRLYGLPPLGPAPDLRRRVLIATCPYCGWPALRKEPIQWFNNSVA